MANKVEAGKWEIRRLITGGELMPHSRLYL